MKNIIAEIATNYINDILNFFSTDDIPSLAKIEQELLPKAKDFICSISSLYYEDVNNNLVEDKVGRKKEGYSIERHNDIRKILTTIGELEFKRTYFSYKDGGHVYLVDIAAGIESHVRLSEELSEACKSKDVSKFNAADRIIGTQLLGLGSAAMGISFICNTCKYTW